jgi:hypothetical protein
MNLPQPPFTLKVEAACSPAKLVHICYSTFCVILDGSNLHWTENLTLISRDFLITCVCHHTCKVIFNTECVHVVVRTSGLCSWDLRYESEA